MSDLELSTQSSGFTQITGSKIDSLASTFISSEKVQEALRSSRTSPSRHSKAHITLIDRAEASILSSKFIQPDSLFPSSVLQDVHFVGLGSTSRSDDANSYTSFHIVAISPSINRVRLKSGLGFKDLHVTLTDSVLNSSRSKELSKGLSSLVDQAVLKCNSSIQDSDSLVMSFSLQEALSKHYLLLGKLDEALESSVKLVEDLLSANPCLSSDSSFRNSNDPIIVDQLSKGLFVLANVAFENSYFRLALLSFSQVYQLNTNCDSNEKLKKSLKGILSCWRFTELGPCYSKEEWSQLSFLSTSLLKILFQTWERDLKEKLRVSIEERSREMGWSVDDRLVCERGKRLMIRIEEPEVGLFDRKPDEKIAFHELQRFFSWVIPFRLCASSTPRTASDILVLQAFGITHVLTLTLESPLPQAWFDSTEVGYTFLPVADGQSPSIADYRVFMSLALDVMSDEGCLLVHCAGGKGRAGSLLSSYLAAFGIQSCSKEWSYPQLGASQAMEKVRLLRPGSIETQVQEEGIKKWVQEILQHGALPSIVEEPKPSSPMLTSPNCSEVPLRLNSSSRALDGIDLLVLVGLPASGKSSFRNLLCARNPSRWISVNGDEDGGRKAVETALSNFGRNSNSQSSLQGLVIDQCSVTASSRKTILQLAQRCSKPVVVYFDFSTELCISRASLRPSHPSIKPSSASNVIKGFAKKLETPTLKEGFSSIISVTSFQASEQLSQLLSPVDIFKFPRTPHLLNLGAATPDDLVQRATVSLDQEVSKGDRQSNLSDASSRCLITEKVDGANVGISLSDSKSLQVQNRAHWVSNDPQFKKLEAWLEKHRVELYALLDRQNEGFAGRFVLFGEWLAATHSIPYTRLDSLFIAFDLYDRMKQVFLPRNQVVALFKQFSPSISLVPLLHVLPSLPSDAQLIEMVQSKSQFYDGRLEGVYIKLESDIKVIGRGKCVRKDFICGNEHWSKGIRQWNGIVNENIE